jgi:two-component system response regulator HydG
MTSREDERAETADPPESRAAAESEPDAAPARKRRILVVDDEPEIRDTIAVILRKAGYDADVAPAARAAIEMLAAERYELILTDYRMPDLDGIELLRLVKARQPETEVVILTGYGTIDVAVQAIREGAYDFVQKPIKRLAILKTVEKAIERRALLVENRALREELSTIRGQKETIAASPAMRRTLEIAEQVASSAATVLVTGESGTGKEVVANIVHYASPRKGKPFIKVSCAAIPETLLEAELFGHERGAFTGAHQQRKGRFELADQGTLFLDEVGEMSPSTQVKLLRVLQEGEFERLGGTKTLRVNVRVIAATNVNLEEAVASKLFRRDLFYRLNVITISIPPLRERPEDIPLLAEYSLRRWCAKNGRRIESITAEAMERLLAYPWPGNVRELENVIERAVILSRGSAIEVDDLPPAFGSVQPPSGEIRVPVGTTMERMEQILIDETLRHTGGNKERAARLLGVATRTIYRKVDRRKPA